MNLLEELEQQQREVLATRQGIERQLGAIVDKSDPRRESLKREHEALGSRLRWLKEEIKAENTRRNYAGIGSPLHEACVARLDPALVAELEADAFARQQERLRRAEERRAQKPAAAAPSPSPPSNAPAAAKPGPAPPEPPPAKRPARPVVVDVNVRLPPRPAPAVHRGPERSRA
ncbi:MAG: hypothetical protein JOZ69_10895 [Myxococcales bacterium]|nr:hypothetical protein [Myxococcales bacterium]